MKTSRFSVICKHNEIFPFFKIISCNYSKQFVKIIYANEAKKQKINKNNNLNPVNYNVLMFGL